MENNLQETPINNSSDSQQIVQQPIQAQKGSLPMIIGGLALLIVGLGGGYYLGTQQPQSVIVQTQKNSDQSVEINPPLSTDTPSVQETSTPIAKDTTINIDFKLPQRLASEGELKKAVFGPNEVQSGTMICWMLASSDNCDSSPYFSIRSTSIDFAYPRGGSFLDLQGFVYEDGRYRLRFVGQRLNDEFSQENITKINNMYGVEGIKIQQEVVPDEGPSINASLDGRVGAVFNTNDENFLGVSIMFESENGLTDEEIDQVLQTFKFVDK